MLFSYEQIITATDAELVAAFRKIVAELNVRDTEAVIAAKEAFVDEQVKRKNLEAEMQSGLKEAESVLHQQKIEAQAEKNRSLFEEKKAFAEKIAEIMRRHDLTIRAWSHEADKRLY